VARVRGYEQARAAQHSFERSDVQHLAMPIHLRRHLPAVALAAAVFAVAAPTAHSGPAPYEPQPAAPKPTLGERAAALALDAVGVPYRWGGSSPAGGFDCSGLVYWAYGRLGVELPHSSYALYERGRPVTRSRMKAGDLLFFSGLGHVGIYLGRGRMVHAPRSGRLVEVVTLGLSGYGGRLVGARRIART
jgi:murein DD-endopeptidase